MVVVNTRHTIKHPIVKVSTYTTRTTGVVNSKQCPSIYECVPAHIEPNDTIGCHSILTKLIDNRVSLATQNTEDSHIGSSS
jgi:hypothetical protein